MDTRKILNYALQREHEGKRFFEENARRLSSAAAVGAFKRLAAEEQLHIEFIEKQIELLAGGKPFSAEAPAGLEGEGFFAARAESEMIEQTVDEAMVADLPVLRMAYLIERDFAEFYETSAAKATGEAQRVLKMLSAWERGHEALFKQLHDKAFEEYAQMPWGG
ncbi:MAG: ferritin family protein [Candidatus Krumholzibacteria bacterium]|nr:ferritin family protein [Candidatus Krumholzibacteria bacterium]